MRAWEDILKMHGLITDYELEWLRDNAFGNAVELGSLEGKSSCAIAMSAASVICIDLWPEVERCAAFLVNTRGFPIVGIRSDSVNAASLFLDASFDFVFIDTSHEPEQTTREIKAWVPKMRSRALVCGHDYTWPGMKEVVTNFFPSHSVNQGIWHIRL